MADSSWVLIDDRDPGIAYGPSNSTTIWHGGVAQEYMQTTTGLDPNDTATYYFNASSIAVFGTYGPAGGAGPVIATYQIDNTPTTTVTGSASQATLYRQNFWTSDSQLPLLAPGAFHQLVVTNMASTLWVDYLAYPPDATANTSSASTSPLTLTSTTSATLPTSLTASASPTGSSNTNTNVGATIAGVVIGAVAFILAIVAPVIYIRRRRPRPIAMENVRAGEVQASPDMSQSHSTIRTPSMTPFPLSSEGAPYSSIPQGESLRGEFPRPLPQVLARTFDGGVSLMGGPLQIPPEYHE